MPTSKTSRLNSSRPNTWRATRTAGSWSGRERRRQHHRQAQFQPLLEAGWLQEKEDRYELTGPLPPLAIPTTLQDALRARLDRLTDGKAAAQLGAVLGRTFAYELLQAVAPLDEL